MSDIRAWPAAMALVPPISVADRERLRQSIETDGVMTPIVVMADGRIVDGHNRWELSGGNCAIDRRDLTDEEGLRLAVILNFCRRHMTDDQKAEARRYFEAHPDAFRQAVTELDKEGKTQKEIAERTGYSPQRVSEVQIEIRSSSASGTASAQPQDGNSKRAKIPKDDYEAIVARIAAGESQVQIGRTYGASNSAIRQFVQRAERHAANPDAPNPHRRLTDEQELAVLAWRNAGDPVSNIAYRFNVSEFVIKGAIERATASGAPPPDLEAVPANVVQIGTARAAKAPPPPKRRMSAAWAEREIRRRVGDVTRTVEILDSLRSMHGGALAEALATSAERTWAIEELERCADRLRAVMTTLGQDRPEREGRDHGSAAR